MAKSYIHSFGPNLPPNAAAWAAYQILDEFIIDQQDLRRNNCSADLSGKQIISYYSNIYSLQQQGTENISGIIVPTYKIIDRVLLRVTTDSSKPGLLEIITDLIPKKDIKIALSHIN